MVQRRAAHYVSNRHGNRVDSMLEHLQWRSLEQRRRGARLIILYKIVNNDVALDKSDKLTPPFRRTRHSHQLAFQLPSSSSDYRKFSFFPRTIMEWNALPPGIVSLKTPNTFKA
ncbi:hypothetical protein FSP39_000419 [Pinctada imbricata]|uniref:Uncharacterized protein n=1 Tax=Pinctada imbricata TaxID=66713 RepID=A0AA88XKC7_PINIB|nr:hypothetical protein FSP39_000419 [Pinctada imbricata]